MGKVICLASAKGGSGKTILTATFGAFLTSLNKKVLIVDIDGSTNGLSLLYLKEVNTQNEIALSEGRKAIGTYEVVNSNSRFEVVTLANGVRLIPATYSFINTESVDLENFALALSIIRRIDRYKYDYIFLDAQAGSDHFAHAAMNKNISDEVIIVSEYDPLSAAGVERLKAFFREDLTYNRTWVLLNKLLPDFVKSFSDFLGVAKYLTPIPWDAEVVKAYSRRELALDLKYGNEFTLAILQVLKALFRDEITEDLSDWLKEKTSVIKEPIRVQYDDTMKQLEILFKSEKMLQKNLSPGDFKNILDYSIVLLLGLAIGSVLELTSNNIALSDAPIVKYISIGIPFLLVLSFALNRYFQRKKAVNSKAEMERYKIRREIGSLEEKLKKLEAIMSADPEDLIKSNTKGR